MLLLQSAAGVLALGLPPRMGAAAGPAKPAPADATPGFFDNFRGITLRDQDNKPLRTAQFNSKLVLVHFVFTGCSTTCPIQTRALADMQAQLAPALRRQVQLLSVSLDPLHDSPQVLKAYAQRMGADESGWRFATGRPPDIERVSDALRLFRPGPQARKLDDHSTALWLVDATGQLRMRYSGNPVDVPRLLRELAALAALPQAPKA
ncbi:MAG: SCO family protein [Aquabacterium sp.]|nr:SCO family protein [Aquabacterium sp.]